MKIVEHLRAKETADRAGLIVRYRDILSAGDSATAEQIHELQSIMEKLGFDSARVAADADAIALRGRLQAMSQASEAAEKAMIEARRKHDLWCTEAERIIRETEGKTKATLAAKHAAETKFFGCRNAARRLIDLNAANLELFGVSSRDVEESEREHMGQNLR